MVVKERVERYLRSAEGRSFPKVATDVLLDVKGCFFGGAEYTIERAFWRFLIDLLWDRKCIYN
jgi:hypothetical protein